MDDSAADTDLSWLVSSMFSSFPLQIICSRSETKLIENIWQIEQIVMWLVTVINLDAVFF